MGGHWLTLRKGCTPVFPAHDAYISPIVSSSCVSQRAWYVLARTLCEDTNQLVLSGTIRESWSCQARYSNIYDTSLFSDRSLIVPLVRVSWDGEVRPQNEKCPLGYAFPLWRGVRIECTHSVLVHSMRTPQNNRNAYMHEEETIGLVYALWSGNT